MKDLPGLVSERDMQEEKKRRSYVPSVFITASLPLRDTNKKFFERKYNNITMYLQAVHKVPFGKYGRLLLSVLTTHAVQQSELGEVSLHYKSMADLLKEMDLQRQRTAAVREQLECFKTTTFSYEQRITRKTSSALFKEYDLDSENFTATAIRYDTVRFMSSMQYIELDDGNVNNAVEFTIKLSPEFVNMCKKHSVPIDYTTYKEISSPLGKDLYAWFVYRNNSMGAAPVFFSRDTMIDQFMPVKGDRNIAQLKNSNWNYIKGQVEGIKRKYYPGLNVSFNEIGMYFSKSPAIMLPKDQRYVLITNDIK